MSQSDAVEALIALTSSLKDNVRALCDEYLQRPATIERERRVLRERDFNALMELKEEYDAQNGRVEALVDSLRTNCQKLASWQSRLAQSPDEAAHRAPETVSEAVALLDRLSHNLKGSELAKKVLDHLVQGVKAVWADFLARKQAIDPLIEQNRYLVESLIRNYQESYRFWQEIREQVVTNYDPSGKQRTKGQGSGFAIRA